MAAPTKVVTGDVRLSYANLLSPRRPNEKADPKYSVVLLIPKNTRDGQETVAKIRAAQDAAAEEGKAKLGGKIPPGGWRTMPKITDTLHDGDTDQDLESNPEYAGHWYISVSSSEAYPPNVVDRRLQKITDASEVYSGMWANVSMVGYAFNTQGNKGVSFGLRNVRKVRDDEPFGGVSRAEDDFEPLDDPDDGGGLI